MRRALRATLVALASIVTVGLSISAASAADPVDDAITALQQTSVFVEPGTSGTDPDTTDYLQKFLEPDDHIVIVMINESPMTDDAVAQAILGSLPEPSILGLYVNGQISVHNSRDSIPESAVNTAMDSAKAISMNAPETLTTFTRLMHRYQAEHPEPITETSTTTSTTPDTTSSAVPIAGGLLGIAIIAAIVVTSLRKRKFAQQADAVAFKETPVNVRDKAKRVLALRSRLRDPRLIESLTNIGVYLEDYFRNATQQDDGSYKNVDEIRANVDRLLAVVSQYLRGQEKPRQFHQIESRQQRYSVAITSFERFMLDQVRNANADRDFDTAQAVQILSASDLRTIRPK